MKGYVDYQMSDERSSNGGRGAAERRCQQVRAFLAALWKDKWGFAGTQLSIVAFWVVVWYAPLCYLLLRSGTLVAPLTAWATGFAALTAFKYAFPVPKTMDELTTAIAEWLAEWLPRIRCASVLWTGACCLALGGITIATPVALDAAYRPSLFGSAQWPEGATPTPMHAWADAPPPSQALLWGWVLSTLGIVACLLACCCVPCGGALLKVSVHHSARLQPRAAPRSPGMSR